MANRFLETNYYKSPFVKKLPGPLKSLYSYIICDCTPSGIWCLDLDIAKLFIGFEITFDEFKTHFINTGKAKEISAGKFFFPDFIEHQYPGGLSDVNKAHKNILLELRKFKLINTENAPIKEAPLEAPLEESLYNPLKGVQGNGNVMDKVMVKEEKTEKKTFNTKPLASDFNGLPTQYITSSIEFVFQTSQSLITNENVIKLWEIFKVQNLTGEDYYPNEGKVYNHFTNWIKKQKFTNGNNSGTHGSSTSKQGTSTARTEALRNW